ncbi:MAG: amino acid adenylation domain-containing protein [Verrucomicrobia bacterium]|nr:amino acid adenylation domain-containing protein [Verrucomicrobiota bacterium]
MNSVNTELLAQLKQAFGDLAGQDLADAGPESTFLDLGFDSLFLTQAAALLKNRFGVKITFRQLLEEFTSLGALARQLDQHMPADRRPQPARAASQPVPATVQPVATGLPPAAEVPVTEVTASGGRALTSTVLERVMKEQLRVMEQQLTLLRGSTPASTAFAGALAGTAVQPSGASASAVPAASASLDTGVPFAAVAESEPAPAPGPAQHGPFRQPDRSPKGGLTELQQDYLGRFMARYVARTPKSKEYTQLHRERFADPRAVAGFKPNWKEMVYPIVSERSSGAHIWDIDGNRWVDVTLGFGVALLGHSPKFITEAVKAQLDLGVEIGPQSALAGEVAELICEFTGMDRVTFCNTGSEAVMAALRLCRTVTGRTRVVVFSGAYHGTFDEVLVRGAMIRGEPKTLAIAPGIAPNLISEVVVLEYGAAASLEWIRAHAEELAAVLVEVVQSRHPDLQPREFLQELREITRAAETPLIFDEVITGFRCHPGGAQAYFGIRADLATYGKIVGGGMPLGFVAGRRELMDAFDGGAWQYGDDSFPAVGVTFFAGTFVRHPLAMAAAKAMLHHLKAEGPQLQAGLAARTERMLGELNRYFERHEVPVHLERFTSQWYPHFGAEVKWGSLLYYHLREKGLHIWEGRPCFLSTAHTTEDEEFIIRAFKQSVAEMQAGGFLPGRSDGEFKALPGARSRANESEAAEAAGKRQQLQESPLTDAQKEIWLSASMGEDANCAYNESITVHLNGTLEVPVLECALLELLQRHPALRSRFSEGGEKQVYEEPPTHLELRLEDWSGLEESEAAGRLAAACAEEQRTPFDLVHGPLVRFWLAVLTPVKHALVVTAHHLVCDGWSFGMLVAELSTLYNARLAGGQAKLPPAMSFGDYARELEKEQGSSERRSAEAYWIEKFKDGAPALELPTDRPRPATKTYAGSMTSRVMDPDRYARLKRATPKLGGTLFSTLLAAFAALLYRLSGQRDLVVGVPAAGQTLVGCDELIGHCLHFLPMRFKCESDIPFGEFAAGVKRTVLDAYEHQTMTYGTLVQRLRLPRDPSRLPLVSVIFNIDKFGFDRLRMTGLDVRVTTNPKQFVNMDLFFNLIQAEASLEIECEYNTDLFDRDTIERWLGHFETLVEGIIAQGDRALGNLQLLSESDRSQLLIEWNQTAHDYPRDVAIHELFAEQARRNPSKTAVRCCEQSLTYAELDDATNRLAARLQNLGLQSGDLVGVCLERSIAMVVGVLGILKAGVAYVPLDPRFPVERLALMIEDAKIQVLVTQADLVGLLAKRISETVVLDETPLSAPGEFVPRQVRGPDLAHVIFTSGSTGRPKGVEITHRSIVNLLHSMQREPGLVESDVLLAVTTLSFDMAGLELLLPLVSGATVVIAPRDAVLDGQLLKEELARSEATVMQATPVTWRMLVTAGWRGDKRLKVMSGGEPFPRDLANQLAGSCREVWNLYGPTETTVYSTGCRLYPDQGLITIGRPIANTQVFILDDRLQPVPIGVVGELYIAGDGLARGYLGQPELTARKFISNPFSTDQAERMYRTGDLARYRSDGSIEFLGRNDYQVKIRGFRIELGEIEMALARHDAVGQAVVVVREDSPDSKLLVAYVVPRAPGIAPDDLRRHLREHLPEYMVPAHYVFLERFPLTPNNKIDRARLPKPEDARSDLQSEFVAPRTPTETALVEIWEKVLGVPQVGIHDNFFELGGESMLAMRVIMQAGKSGMVLRPLSIFKHQTIAELATSIDQSSAKCSEQGVVAGPVPLTPGQMRFWFDRTTCDRHHWNVSTIVQAPRLDPDAIHRALRKVVAHHDALRMRLTESNGEWHQLASPSTDDISFQSYDLTELVVEQQRLEIESRCARLQGSLDLMNGPVFCVAHFRCGAKQHDRLFFALHHFVIDALSWNVFWEDFEGAYQQASQGSEIVLPRQTTSFFNWAGKLPRLAESTKVQRAIPQWLALPWGEVERLPLDYPASPNANSNQSAEMHEFCLNLKESEPIVRRSRSYQPEHFLVTALAQVLARWTNSSVVLIDSLGHGRNMVEDADLSRTVGFMLVYEPMVVRVPKSSDASSLVTSTAEQLRALPPGYTLDLLRFHCGNPDLKASFQSLPRSEVLFNYTGAQGVDPIETSGVFEPCSDLHGADESPRGLRYYPLAVNAAIERGCVRVRMVYSRALHKRETIEQLADDYRGVLEEMARAHAQRTCLSVEVSAS